MFEIQYNTALFLLLINVHLFINRQYYILMWQTPGEPNHCPLHFIALFPFEYFQAMGPCGGMMKSKSGPFGYVSYRSHLACN